LGHFKDHSKVLQENIVTENLENVISQSLLARFTLIRDTPVPAACVGKPWQPACTNTHAPQANPRGDVHPAPVRHTGQQLRQGGTVPRGAAAWQKFWRLCKAGWVCSGRCPVPFACQAHSQSPTRAFCPCRFVNEGVFLFFAPYIAQCDGGLIHHLGSQSNHQNTASERQSCC